MHMVMKAEAGGDEGSSALALIHFDTDLIKSILSYRELFQMGKARHNDTLVSMTFDYPLYYYREDLDLEHVLFEKEIKYFEKNSYAFLFVEDDRPGLVAAFEDDEDDTIETCSDQIVICDDFWYFKALEEHTDNSLTSRLFKYKMLTDILNRMPIDELNVRYK